jgi:acyl-CoA thioester hydrolase
LKRNQTRIRVIYADTDAMGIVYHTNYIKWFEIGRNELFREMDMPYAWIEQQGYGMPLTEVFAHYLYPAEYDQLLWVETGIGFVKRASLRFDYVIWDEPRERMLVEGHTVHAFVDRGRRIVRIPPLILDRIRKTEETGETYGG